MYNGKSFDALFIVERASHRHWHSPFCKREPDGVELCVLVSNGFYDELDLDTGCLEFLESILFEVGHDVGIRSLRRERIWNHDARLIPPA